MRKTKLWRKCMWTRLVSEQGWEGDVFTGWTVINLIHIHENNLFRDASITPYMVNTCLQFLAEKDADRKHHSEKRGRVTSSVSSLFTDQQVKETCTETHAKKKESWPGWILRWRNKHWMKNWQRSLSTHVTKTNQNKQPHQWVSDPAYIQKGQVTLVKWLTCTQLSPLLTETWNLNIDACHRAGVGYEHTLNVCPTCYLEINN